MLHRVQPVGRPGNIGEGSRWRSPRRGHETAHRIEHPVLNVEEQAFFAESAAIRTEVEGYIHTTRYRGVAGPPIVGFAFIAAGVLVVALELLGVLSLLSCAGGTFVLAGLSLLLFGTGIGLLVHPTVLVVADILGAIAFLIGIVGTGTGHC